MNKVGLASMNNVVIASMNNVELASMNKVVLASMNNVELAIVVNNGVKVVQQSCAAPSKQYSQQGCSAMITMLLQTMLTNEIT